MNLIRGIGALAHSENPPTPRLFCTVGSLTPSLMGWMMNAVRRRAGTHIARLVAAVAVASMGGVAAMAAVGGGKTDNLSAFNACIHRSRFLALTKQASGGRIIETIRDRAWKIVEGRFAVMPSVRAAELFARTLPVGGSGVINGRMVLLTNASEGLAASTIQACGRAEFPGP